MDSYERALLQTVNDKLDRILHLLQAANDLKGIDHKLDRVLQYLQILKHQGELMSAEMDRLEKSVAAEADVVTSVETTLAGLSQQLKDAIAAGADPAKLTALADQIDQYKARLAAAVVANTPTPTPPPKKP